ncbi:cysteine proteinase [Choiromyces venosus 120613-1]|uniref:ubiquitinyl hydrolase 1 n=1 Tax=Choiromyces venosus 120613-1 TaxID=1336337 RepID=A0A3N4JEN7_9PEZI|nr:cysteine proteinase [Choiromyces venosus 120613-1]
MSSHTSPPSRPTPGHAMRVYPHVHDLVARTAGLQPPDRSIKAWLEAASRYWRQANSHLTFGSQDAAYVDYLLAFEIVANVIPRCQDFPTFKCTAGRPYHELEKLKKELMKKIPEFDKVKEEIKKNNEISGVVSAQAQLEAQAQMRALKSSSVNNGNSTIVSKKPDIKPKPDILSSRPFPGDASSKAGKAAVVNLDLKARFNKLAMTSGRPTTPSGSQNNRQSASTNLHGPREMPAKLPPLDVNVMPKLPAPTYSPATSFTSPTGIPPHRSSARPSLPTQVPTESASTGPRPAAPKETTISVDTLCNYLCKESDVSVLLLDVRPRNEFMAGHIYYRSIVCVEPIKLREGMSGEDLDATFVLEPDKEVDLFSRRHDYDFVVYYDQSTSSNSFLSGLTNDQHLIGLRSLHLAMDDFAFGKRLKNPPLLLIGGLDAWTDLVGEQALEIVEPEAPSINRSDIRHSAPPGRSLAQRRQDRDSHRGSLPPPLGRQSYTNNEKSTQPYAIDIEEEQRWMERLQKEREPVTMTAISSADEVDIKKRRRGTSIVTSSDMPHVQTVEEFFQRYPATPHTQQSMISPTLSTPQQDHFPTSSTRRPTIIDHPFHGFTDVRNPEFNPPPSPARPPPAVPRKSYSGVSERLAPVVPPPPPPAPERPPKIPLVTSRSPLPPFAGMGTVNIGITGLKNLGNTCYMNAVLQCMSGTIPLSRYFLGGSYKSHVNKDNPLGSRGVLAEAFATIVRHLWSGEYSFISPVTIKDVSGRLNEMFRNNDQQDAQEFLEFLLDGLHEDLNPHANHGKLRPLNEEEERRRERLPAQRASVIEWERYTHNNFSVVVNWFQGQLSSKLSCLVCKRTSTTYSPFMYLSLPIPASKSSTFTLRDCLEEFVKEETLEGDDAWHCPQCKKARKATKKLTITRLPHILIIHIKRFTNRGPWRDKLNTFVDIPLRHLDLTGYVPPPLARDELPRNLPSPTAETTPPFFYDLYAVCNHYGTINGGHYTAMVRSSYKSGWNLFDDSKTTFIEEAKVVTRNAYVLFWVRGHVM